jgi:ribosomal protein L22
VDVEAAPPADTEAAPPAAETGAASPTAEAEAAAEDSEDEGVERHEAGEAAAEEDEEAAAPEAETEPGAEEAKPSRRRRRGAGAESEPEPRAVPAPSRRRRAQRDPSLPPPVVRAQAKYVRSSPRKARLVCDHIRGKSVEEARAILAHTPRAVARDWSKLLESAVANAEHNHELVGEDLYVKAVHADDGPTIKRFRPRAMGRATRIRKRTSHLTILLTPKG